MDKINLTKHHDENYLLHHVGREQTGGVPLKKYISEKGEAPKNERTNLIMGVFKFKADKMSFNIEVSIIIKYYFSI